MKKVILLILVLLTLTSCKSQNRYSVEFLNSFDTVTQLIAYTENETEFNEIAKIVSKKLTYYDKLFDIYEDFDGINNIKTINDQAGKQAVEVENEIIDLLNFAKKQYEITDGKVNVAFGSVLKIWHDYRGKGEEIPSVSELEKANENCNIDDVIIKDNTVFFKNPNMSLDVGAIAKGFCADLIINELKANNYTSVFLNMGGNIKTIGNKPNGENWLVGVQNYNLESENNVLISLNIGEKSVVTSGDYQRFYEVDGKRYHHIIDSETLFPSDHFHSVTVIGESSALCDSFSTALFSMNIEKAEKLAKENNLAVIWVIDENNIKYSENIDEYIK